MLHSAPASQAECVGAFCDILSRFREGCYRAVVTSRVLNEGIDVPSATIGIVLSGTGSRREYVQRLGRILRRGNDPNKIAFLYEVIAEDTTEEGTARRRNKKRKPVYYVNAKQGKLDIDGK
jgi:superfamily II DNA or RNA helicase